MACLVRGLLCAEDMTEQPDQLPRRTGQSVDSSHPPGSDPSTDVRCDGFSSPYGSLTSDLDFAVEDDWELLEAAPRAPPAPASTPMWLLEAFDAAAPAQGWESFCQYLSTRGGVAGLRKAPLHEQTTWLDSWLSSLPASEVCRAHREPAAAALRRWCSDSDPLPRRTSRPSTLAFNPRGCPRREMEPRTLAPTCRGCQREFGMVRRPHRCRGCGGRFCAACTKDTLVLPHYGRESQRVCAVCKDDALRAGSAVSVSRPAVAAQLRSAVVHGAQKCREKLDGIRRRDFCPGCRGPAWLLGASFRDPGGEDRDRFEVCLNSFLWMSYRRGFVLGGCAGGYDTGWGCVHRAGQMLLGTALRRHECAGLAMPKMPSGGTFPHTPVGSPGRRRQETEGSVCSTVISDDDLVASLFRDVDGAPFSIQSLSAAGAAVGTPVGEWFAPTTFAHAAAAAASKLHGPPFEERPFSVCISEHGDIPKASLARAVRDGGGVLLLCPLRLGAQHTNPDYHASVLAVLRSPRCAGIVGGRNRQAVYFVGFRLPDEGDVSDGACSSPAGSDRGREGPHLIHLDPHRVQEAYLDRSTTGSLRDPGRNSIPLAELSPSVLVSFYASDASEVAALLSDIESINSAGRHQIFSVSGH
eukprot:TRINITY_DN1826_c0_g2_i1.p1 TRINITY_DN1826_c0_g2~~TRINITY_DN1826_c0_g2_i1.p1  ORF type:complete len:638 (+),score=186.72 TRINITY_DN1826_c0_g2_i1:85-1998(+)